MTFSDEQWRIPAFILIAAFLIASLIWMAPQTYAPKPDGHTKNLHVITTREGNTERKDYVDDDGIIRTAGDAGYATIITTISDNSRLERYYDEQGLPVKRYSGYFAALREYDDAGRNFHVAYLGSDHEPVTTSAGYSDIFRTFYDSGRIKTEKYYDPSGMPVRTSTYGYGFINEYDDEGNVIRITYLDEKDQPMVVGLGYAIVTRTWHASDKPDGGRIEYEFYYDENGKPIAQSLGHYGVYKAEYNLNRQNAVLIYLDSEGRPMATKRGYASVNRTYYTDNTIKTERYFDTEGQPYRMPDGQYGEKYENDQVIYLDKNGNEQFNLRRLLYNHSYLVILSASALVLLAAFTGKRTNLILALLYSAVIGYMTLLFREKVNGSTSHEMLWAYSSFFTDDTARLGILKNIWLFIPLGAFLYRIGHGKSAVMIPAAYSIMIEVVQLFTGTGYCETDDIISNSLGGAAGYAACSLLSGLKNKFMMRKNNVLLSNRRNDDKI